MTTLASQILATIRQKPGIRTIQICDAVDCDIELVEQVLASLLREQKISVREGIAPNQRKAKFFTIAGEDAQAKAVTTPANAPAQKAGADVDNPAPAERAAPKTKVDLAIDYVCQHGTATTDQLRAVMGLQNHQHPLGWLSSAVRAGELTRSGTKGWVAGPSLKDPAAKAPRATSAASKVETLPTTPTAPAPATAQAPASSIATTPPAPAIAETAAKAANAAVTSSLVVSRSTPLTVPELPPAYRAPAKVNAPFVAGLYSDGELHIRVRGDWIALSANDTQALKQLLQGAA